MRIETKTTLGTDRYADVHEIQAVNDDGSLIAEGNTRYVMWHKEKLPTLEYAAQNLVRAMEKQLSEVREVLNAAGLLGRVK